MKASHGLLSAGALLLALAACQSAAPTAEDAAAPGDSAGSAGPAYCETVPSNPDDMEQWNKLCSPGGKF
ncbi:MAG TPA: hypothetical protein VFN28_01240 [Amaricoccus sp.]|nr:hypothetical protein [Amaricoccus sp.]